MPKQTSEFGGVPIYENSRLILTKSSRPYWLPVTREQFLNGMIAKTAPLAEQEEHNRSEGYRKWVADKPERKKTQDQLYALFKKQDPAAAEKYLQESAKNESQMEAQLKETTSAGSFQGKWLQAYRSELAALSPAERASEAWCGPRPNPNEPGTCLVPAGTSESVRLITLNPAFFDPAKRGEMQLITVEIGWDPPGRVPADISNFSSDRDLINARLLDFLRQTDWHAVGNLAE